MARGRIGSAVESAAAIWERPALCTHAKTTVITSALAPQPHLVARGDLGVREGVGAASSTPATTVSRGRARE